MGEKEMIGWLLVVTVVSQASGFGYGGMGMIPGKMPWMMPGMMPWMFGYPGMMPWMNGYGKHGKHGKPGKPGKQGKRGYGKYGYGWDPLAPYKFARSSIYNPYFADTVMKPFNGMTDYGQIAHQLAVGHNDFETPYKNVNMRFDSQVYNPPASAHKRSRRSTGYGFGGHGYTTGILPVERPWNSMGYNYPGMAYNPYYSYSKSGYYNWLNKQLRYMKMGLYGKGEDEEHHGRKKRSLGYGPYGGSNYFMKQLPVMRPWMNFGYNYPGFGFNPFFNYGKSGYFNWMNKRMPIHAYGKY